ncbi:MAG: carbamoyltransferase HypF [Firmicutes bacterium]|nr:carbamoyltransferase HypF [Bacillota bacterium]
MNVKLAAKAGFCFGVKRALDMAERTVETSPAVSLGPLIHNQQVVKRLAERGIRVVDALEDVSAEQALIIRSHGVGPSVYQGAENKGIQVVDATCPFVRRAQELAKDLTGRGYTVVVVGDRKHPEVRGIVGWTGGQAHVVEGPEEAVDSFVRELQLSPPPLSKIDSFATGPLPWRGYKDFRILLSRGDASGETVVPPDAAVCPDCRREINDPGDRRYRYPFTNCTACGPRFTIVQGLPYDRCRTSMARFPMCPACAREYEDPGDRRFHAQPVACPDCGPGLTLVDRSGRPQAGDPLERCRELLRAGRLVAVKGLGGFHLACNASDPEAVRRLRRRKGRPAKPFAVMCRDLETVERYCRINGKEAAVLSSPEAPIVVLEQIPGCPLPPEVAPGLRSLGVMLPYTPLHLLLFDASLPVLVMTSGNRSELPLVVGNRQALAELGGLADYFLWHDRDIVNRCDDSVVAVVDGEVQFLRRSRGYVPRPLAVPFAVAGGAALPAAGDAVVLGAGGDVKNTFCLLIKGRAYVSQHNGEMELLEGQEAYKAGLAGLCRLLKADPEVVAFDPHPGYLVSALARSLPAAFHIEVQHHHAHMASCMAENGLNETVIGAILDGTGYGPGGRMWGFEILIGDYLDFTRKFHLAYVPLPGGERSVKNPWMTAVAYLLTFLGKEGLAAANALFPGRSAEIALIERIIATGFNAPPACGCGRLFDAVSALLGVCLENSYEGEAAVKLEELARREEEGGGEEICALAENSYSFTIGNGVINPGPMLAGVLHDLKNGIPPAEIARRFHGTVAAMVVESVRRAGREEGVGKVVLSGGCWHNRRLLRTAGKMLEAMGFKVFSHNKVPPGDGGLSLGQAVVGYHSWVAKNNCPG